MSNASYSYNKDEVIKHLSEKLERCRSAYGELKKKHVGTYQMNEDLKRGVANAKKAMHFAVAKENFLRDRVIRKYGRAAFAELMNTVENPGQFNAELFKEVSQKLEGA